MNIDKTLPGMPACHIYHPKKSLLMIDGDNINISSVSAIIKRLQQKKSLEIEIFCNKDSVEGWTKHKAAYLDNATFHLTKSEPQAVDLKINARIIKMLSESISNDLCYSHVYFCSNDSGYLTALFYMAKVLRVTVVSKTESLLNIKNVEPIKIQSEIEPSKKFDTELIKPTMSLVNIGKLLKRKGIKYNKLSKLLLNNGFEIHNGYISKTPLAR